MMEYSKFEMKVFEAARKIPGGKIATYSKIAKIAGKPKAYRAVGNALAKSPGMPSTPCHRVVKSNGEVGGFRWGAKKKIRMLKKEGHKILLGRIIFS